MKKGILTAALENADLPAAVAALRQDVVFHSPILATVGDEVQGRQNPRDGVRLLRAAPQRGGISEPGRAIHRHLRRSRQRQPNPNRRARHRGRHEQGGEPSPIRAPVAGRQAIRAYMERNLRPDPVPDAIWARPASASGK